MSNKTYISDGEQPQSQIGASIEALCATIEARRNTAQVPVGGEKAKTATGVIEFKESYTHSLLNGNLDTLLKKVIEEAGEAALAAKEAHLLDAYSSNDNAYDAAVDHLRYEAGDVVYHLLVLLARFDIGIDELAAELNNRMTEEERPQGAVRLHEEFVRRGK